MDDDALAEEALGHYDFDQPITLELARRGENSTYRLDLPRGSFALRVHRPGYRTADMIRSELAWMEALSGAGVSTPTAVRTIAADVVATLPTDTGERHVSVSGASRPFPPLRRSISPRRKSSTTRLAGALRFTCDVYSDSSSR